MRLETLRHIVYRSPFRPVRLTLDDGTKIVIRHPEAIFISRTLCVASQDPDLPLLFEPDKVLAVQQIRHNGNGRKRA